MSGGSLDYFYSDLQSHIGDFGDRELDDLVKDLAELFREREWFLSCDTCEGSWNESRDKFKDKWFKDGVRAERIEKYLAETREEVLKSLGISNKYCKNCSHWKPEEREDSPYGRCDLTKSCLMHRSESCDKFDERK